MKAQTTGEETITVAVMHNIVYGNATGKNGAGHHFGPQVQIGAGVSAHRRLAGGPTGGMDTHHILEGNGQHTPRIAVA